jgi:hypothetical protein
LNSLKRAIKIYTGYQYTTTQNIEIKKYIIKELVPQGAVLTCARPKPLAPLAVAEDLVKFLFSCDEYKNIHPRIRNQIGFVIQLMLYIGVRPGEIVESDAWGQSNEGLLYKDLDLVYQSTTAYTGWAVYMKLRNRKGHREYKKHA